jgi:hypothetical protein
MSHLQERAIAHVTSLAAGEPVDPSLRVTLHFHPDRQVDGALVLEIIARDGVYRSQFETGTSNGGLTATPATAARRCRTRPAGISLARDGRLEPRIVGDASRAGRYDEQALKQVWHYVARFGTPRCGRRRIRSRR